MVILAGLIAMLVLITVVSKPEKWPAKVADFLRRHRVN